MSRAEELRAKQTRTFEVNGTEYTVRKPGQKDLAIAGARLTFSHAKEAAEQDPEAFLESFGGDVAALVEELKPELTLLARLCALCSVDPKLHDGPEETCPDGQVSIDLIPDDWPRLGRMLLEFSGYAEARAAGKSAEAFREDAGGEADRAGSEVLPGSSESAA